MEVFPYIRTTIFLSFADMGEMTFHLHFANDFSFSLQSSSLTFHILSFFFPLTLAKTQHVQNLIENNPKKQNVRELKSSLKVHMV